MIKRYYRQNFSHLGDKRKLPVFPLIAFHSFLFCWEHRCFQLIHLCIRKTIFSWIIFFHWYFYSNSFSIPFLWDQWQHKTSASASGSASQKSEFYRNRSHQSQEYFYFLHTSSLSVCPTSPVVLSVSEGYYFQTQSPYMALCPWHFPTLRNRILLSAGTFGILGFVIHHKTKCYATKSLW